MPKICSGHWWDLPIDKWTFGSEDKKGLLVEGELTLGNPLADALLATLKHGTVEEGVSVGFSSSCIEC